MSYCGMVSSLIPPKGSHRKFRKGDRTVIIPDPKKETIRHVCLYSQAVRPQQGRL